MSDCDHDDEWSRYFSPVPTAADCREAILLALVHFNQSSEFDETQRNTAWELALSIGARRQFVIGEDVA